MSDDSTEFLRIEQRVSIETAQEVIFMMPPDSVVSSDSDGKTVYIQIGHRVPQDVGLAVKALLKPHDSE